MAISDKYHLQLINLGLKFDSPINILYAILKNEEGKGYLELTKTEGEVPIHGKYTLIEGAIKEEDILSISFPIRPKSLGIKISQKPDFKMCLEKMLPSWLEQGYHFQVSALQKGEIGRQYQNILWVSDSRVNIYQPKLISNIDEIKNYCKEKAINLKVE